MREIPGLQGGVGEAEALPPEVEDLLVKAEADQGPQLDVHPGPRLVVGVVDKVDASVQQLLGAQHLPILLQPNYNFTIISEYLVLYILLFCENVLLKCLTENQS